MPHRFKRIKWPHLLADGFILFTSTYIILSLFSVRPHTFFTLKVNLFSCLISGLYIITFVICGVYDIIWRFISMSEAVRLGKAILIGTLFSAILTAAFQQPIFALKVNLLNLLALSVFLQGIRIARRYMYEKRLGKDLKQGGRRTIIYGAGINGRMLASRLKTDHFLKFNVIGFIDDDLDKIGRPVAGYKVLGSRKDLESILEKQHIRELIIATTHIYGPLLREVIPIAQKFQIRPRMFTGASNRNEKIGALQSIRGVELSDLLSRPQSQIDLSSIRNMVEGKVVLITGAGGSIGSELARQVLDYNPIKLILLEHSEYNLYKIDHELRVSSSKKANKIVSLLADVKDKPRLEQVFVNYNPQIIFHAAAYKHVHLVEANPCSAIMNNVYGTKNLLDLSENVERFLLISTDKAVNPVGVMGATKRLCELMVSIEGIKSSRNFSSVRFGNVLGSSGSLIPLINKQIQNFEPITITHKDMTRYFMLIPEAISLVLNAASIARPSDICILRMGDPIKIVDIVNCMISLLGKSEEDVPIVYTGIRPGEKMYEELYLCGNELKTEHPDILILKNGDISRTFLTYYQNNISRLVDEIVSLANTSDLKSVSKLKSVINFHTIYKGTDQTTLTL